MIKNKCFICGSEKDIIAVGQHDVPLCSEHMTKVQNHRWDRGQQVTFFGDKSKKGIIQSDRTFGVELECVVRNEFNTRVVSLLTNEKYGLGIDSSVSRSEGYACPVEVRAGVFQNSKGEKMLTDLCNLLDSVGTITNESCGTHCHIGVPEYIKEDTITETCLKNLVLFYKIFDPAILCLLPNRRRNGSYCHSATHTNLFELDPETKEPVGDFKETTTIKNMEVGGKYMGINLSSLSTHRRTIEIRYHEGTIDPERLIHWIAFHTAIIDLCLSGEINEADIVKYGFILTEEELLNKLIKLIRHRIKMSTKLAILARFEEFKMFNPPDGYIVKPITKLEKTKIEELKEQKRLEDIEKTKLAYRRAYGERWELYYKGFNNT